MWGKLRSRLVDLGYYAIKRGLKVPDGKMVEKIRRQATLVRTLHDLQVDCVLDVGANQGWFAKRLRMSGYAGPIVGFEPNPDVFAHLQRLSADDPMWTNHQVALGEQDGEAEFNITSESVFSSFLEPVPGIPVKRSEKVQVRRLDALLEECGVSYRRFFLKMDTQGFDLEAFKGAAAVHSHVVGLLSELSVQPLYAGMPHYTEALTHYESAGFELMDVFVVNRTRSGAVLEYDCLMARAEEAT